MGEDLRCSYCSKSKDDVNMLIASPPHEITGHISYICNECVSISVEILIAPNLRARKKEEEDESM